MSTTLLTIQVRYEQDIVMTRQRARQIAQLIGFAPQEQTRIATAVSEIARNAFQYAQGARVEFRIEGKSPQLFLIAVRDRGAGIANLKDILAGHYKSETGMGLGIIGARRLMDQFQIESIPEQGTTILLGKVLPRHVPEVTTKRVLEISNELAWRSSQNPYEEIQQQNQELLQALEDLLAREEQLIQLNRELEDTNRGVVALYAELDEKADSLRRANELKTRFLSNMSHEFRTPLNSILSLSRLLLERMDGELTSEQEKQVLFIRKAAEGLSELVNDLLDLAKVEAGKIIVHPSKFEVGELFATLRGMLKPLLAHNSSIALVFEDPINIPTLYTDEGKVAQILRNFISNALKYTERGEVRVSAVRNGNMLTLAVSDTGIGIAPEDRERIFEDFIQVESYLQRQVKGTGLGLPLARKLAELLGGEVSLESALGTGSIFSASIPIVYPHTNDRSITTLPHWQFDSQYDPILVVEDNTETLFTYQKYFEGSTYQLIEARTLTQANEVLDKLKPTAVILDLFLEGQNTWAFLSQIKHNLATKDIPILVVSVMECENQALLKGADGFLLKPVDRLPLLNKLNTLIKHNRQQKLLLIDDDPVFRYLLKQQLSDTCLNIIEAENGSEGVHLAQVEQPHAVILDLSMPKMSGVEVLTQLKSNPITSKIPVIINSSQPLETDEQQSLKEYTIATLSKDNFSKEEAIAKLREALVKAGISLET